jgi:Ras family
MVAPGSAQKQRDYDYLFKLVLIGDSGVGKSCLLLRFAVSYDDLGLLLNRLVSCDDDADFSQLCLSCFMIMAMHAGRCLYGVIHIHHWRRFSISNCEN